MGTASATSILSGGLAAGLSLLAGEYVLNVVVLGLDVRSAVADFTRLPPDAVIPLLTLNTLLVGVALIWIYSGFVPGGAIGAVAKTSLIGWFLTYVHCAVVTSLMATAAGGVYWLTAAWGVLEVPVAVAIGGWVMRVRHTKRLAAATSA
jgi:hypothetical protein